MVLFLSFADEDRDAADRIRQGLSARGHSTYSRHGDDQASGSAESRIGEADAFIAIMSPSYMSSAVCRRERELASHEEEERLRAEGGQPPFIYVLQVRPMPYNDAGFLRGRTRRDLTGAVDWDAELDTLVGTLPSAGEGARAAADNVQPESPWFRNRTKELAQILDGLTRQNQHFWLVLASPQLGKSWLLDRISTDIQAREPDRWTVRLVDLRDKPPIVRKSVETLLGMLLGSGDPVPADPENLVRLATRIGRAGRFHLCLLDTAELLDTETSQALRSCLSKVHQYIATAGNAQVRLSLIVATRTGEGWTGVSRPRLVKLGLPEFKPDVVVEVMQEMADRTEHRIETEPLAADVHRLSEGLPALLYRYLRWIDSESFTGLDRLRDDVYFYTVSHPYIEQKMLARGSLFGPGVASSEEQRIGVGIALRVLVPYRLLTQSHLSYHVSQSGSLRSILKTLDWPVENLWKAVKDTDLFDRPQPDAWEVVNPPLRRLLCRYWYPTENSRAYAHFTAAQYVRSWGKRQHNRDQSVALVECLWHHSQLLKYSRADDAGERLIELARELSRELTESANWSRGEIRQYAVNRMDDDEELEQAVDDIGASITRLKSAVRTPEGIRP